MLNRRFCTIWGCLPLATSAQVPQPALQVQARPNNSKCPPENPGQLHAMCLCIKALFLLPGTPCTLSLPGQLLSGLKTGLLRGALPEASGHSQSLTSQGITVTCLYASSQVAWRSLGAAHCTTWGTLGPRPVTEARLSAVKA